MPPTDIAPTSDVSLNGKALALLLDHLTDGVVLTDPRDVIVYANATAHQLLGEGLSGSLLCDRLIDDAMGAQIAIRTGHHLAVSELPFTLGFRTRLLHDQGSRISAEQALVRLRGLVEAWPDGVLLCDVVSLTINDANRAARHLLENEGKGLTSEFLPRIFSEQDAERLLKFLRQDLLSRRGALRRELVLRNGIPVEATLIRLDEHQTQGQLTLMAVLRDRSDHLGKLRDVEHKLAKAQSMISIDSLTGLYNRHGFDKALEEFIAAADDGRQFALLIGDIDHFKQINDRHGHQVGDEALKKVSQRIRHQLRNVDLVARYGGEEFCMLVICGPAQLDEIAERIRGAVATTPLGLDDGQRLPVTLSIGACMFAPGLDGETLFERADDALYAAKEAGRNRVEIHRMATHRMTP